MTAAQAIEFTEKLREIDNLFVQDQDAQKILEGWKEGFSPDEIRELWTMLPNDYNTIVRRIRRRLMAAGITATLFKGGPHVN